MAVRIIVLGSLNHDLVIRNDRLPRPGETVIGGDFFQAYGGKGANQAVAAARIARQTVGLVGVVGTDRPGEDYLAHLRREGVDVEYVRRTARHTGVAIILVDRSGENLISVASGANAELSVADVDDIKEAWFREASVWLTNLECPLDAVERGLQRAQKQGLTTLLNPAPMPEDAADVIERLLPLTDVLVPNAVETEMLVGTFSRPEEAAGKLQAYGAKASVLTLGADGCLIREGGHNHRIWAQNVHAVDTTAAGDAFSGALAARIAEGAGLLEAARFANAAAGVAVTKLGAQPSLPTRVRVEELLAGNGAEPWR